MFNAERTIYSKLIENRSKVGQPYIPLLNTTLNEKFAIYPNDDNPSIKYPTINLLTIGHGLTNVNNQSTRLNMQTSPHAAIHAALFNHIPFYIRPVSEFSTNPPSNKLRLHTIETINNVDYNVYYGYSVDNYEYKNELIKFNNIESDFANVSVFDLNVNDVLNPVPNNNISLNSKAYISDFIKIYTFFSLAEINEIINSFTFLHPDIDPIITEIGVCSSKEKLFGTITENVMTQIAYFVDVKQDLNIAKIKEKLDFYIEIGDMEVIAV